MLENIRTMDYESVEAEQAFLNVYQHCTVLRLPYQYNGNLAIKSASIQAWNALRDTMSIIHYTLQKPHKLHRNSQEGKLFETEFTYWWKMHDEMVQKYAKKKD